MTYYVVQERARALYHRLPYQVMPRVMIRYLVMLVASQLNWFPVKDGISEYFSPHAIIKRFAIDYKACRIPFGSYVMASTEPKQKNSLAARMVEAIYLRPSKFMHNGHEVMDLSSGHVLRPGRVVPLPITDKVIARVNEMGKAQQMKSFKIKNRRKELIYDSDWIAGVDYKDQNIDDDDDDLDYEPSVAPYADAQELNDEYYFHEEDEYYYEDYDTDDFIAEENESFTEPEVEEAETNPIESQPEQ